MNRLRIIIDTREQCPWSFDPDLVVSEIGTLKTGDYALKDDDSEFAIERKSLDDFLGTVSTGWERFLREIGRMDNFVAKVVIIEGNFEQTCFKECRGELIPPDHNHTYLTPQFIAKRIAELTMMGVSILFAGNAIYASELAYKIFKERNDEKTANKA